MNRVSFILQLILLNRFLFTIVVFIIIIAIDIVNVVAINIIEIIDTIAMIFIVVVLTVIIALVIMVVIISSCFYSIDSKAGNQDCLSLYALNNFTWHDSGCEFKFHPLCEISYVFILTVIILKECLFLTNYNYSVPTGIKNRSPSCCSSIWSVSVG